jgi:hypothetical protein
LRCYTDCINMVSKRRRTEMHSAMIATALAIATLSARVCYAADAPEPSREKAASLTTEERRMVKEYRKRVAWATAAEIKSLRANLQNKQYGEQVKAQFRQQLKEYTSGKRVVLPFIEARKLKRGNVGHLYYIQRYAQPAKTAKVTQIIDKNNCLIYGNTNYYDPEPIWLVAPTDGLVDGSSINIANMCIVVTGTCAYETVLGGRKTVMQVKAVDIKRLQDAYDEEENLISAQRTARVGAELAAAEQTWKELREGRASRYLAAKRTAKLYEPIKDTDGGRAEYEAATKVLEEVGVIPEEELKQAQKEENEIKKKIQSLHKQLRELQK